MGWIGRSATVCLAWAVLSVAAPVAAQEAGKKQVIRNGVLEVTFDEGAGTFAVRHGPTGKTFLPEGRLGDGKGGTARVADVTDKTFGKGRALEIAYPGGRRDQILLFPEVPWALFRTRLHNDGQEPVIVNKVRPVGGVIDLGVPASQLKALGTGGLREPAKDPGSYVWLAVADPQSRRGVVAGWLTGERGSGVVFSRADRGRVRLDGQIDYGRLRLAAGQTEALETFALGYFEDARLGLEAWADAVARVNGIRLPPEPAGYCTWYHAGASDEKRLAEQAAFAARHLKPFGFSVVQIDDGWQEGVKKNGPRKNFTAHRPGGPYPAGMRAAADHVKAQGLVPGLWLMPFAGTFDDPWFKDHQDWFAKREDGSPFDVKWGGTCLDMTHPGAREYVRGVIGRATHEWGYRYLKLDGLWTGSATEMRYVNDAYKDDQIGNAHFHDPDRTNLDAFRGGLRLVREAAGRDVFLLGCCAPQNMRSYGGAFGLVDAMRIGPDNKAQWPNLLRGPVYGSRNYHLHGRVWYNDPDPVYVRPQLPLEQARLICSWVAVSGQLNFSSEAYADLPPERLDILKRTVPYHGLLPRPVDLFEYDPPRIWLLTDGRRTPRRDVVALYNWDATRAADFDAPLDRLGLAGDRAYVAFDYWDNKLLPPVQGRLRLTVPPQSCRVLAVRPALDRPQLLSTSRHVTQGIVDVVAEEWDGDTRTLSGTSRVVGGDAYELRVVANSSNKGWAVEACEVVGADRDAGVRVRFKQGDGLVRVTIESPASREVSWAVRFQRKANR